MNTPHIFTADDLTAQLADHPAGFIETQHRNFEAHDGSRIATMNTIDGKFAIHPQYDSKGWDPSRLLTLVLIIVKALTNKADIVNQAINIVSSIIADRNAKSSEPPADAQPW